MGVAVIIAIELKLAQEVLLAGEETSQNGIGADLVAFGNTFIIHTKIFQSILLIIEGHNSHPIIHHFLVHSQIRIDNVPYDNINHAIHCIECIWNGKCITD